MSRKRKTGDELSEVMAAISHANALGVARSQVRVLREALKNLANESTGFLGMADVPSHGFTNIKALNLRREEAFAALAATDPERGQ